MKLYNIIKTLMAALLLIALGGCREEVFDDLGHWNGKVPDEWTMSLVIPDTKSVSVGTRADDDDLPVSSLRVLLYKAKAGGGEGDLISNFEIEDGWDVSGNIITVTIPFEQDAAYIHVIANTKISDTEDLASGISATKQAHEVYIDRPADPSSAEEIYWGTSTIEEAVTTSTMTMTRASAMISVSLDSGVSTFKMKKIGVFGTAKQGSIAPSPDNRDTDGVLASSPTVKSGMKYFPEDGVDTPADLLQTWSASDEDSHVIPWVFETEKGDLESGEHPRVIVFGEYTDPTDGTTTEGYYVIGLWERKEAEDGKFSEVPGHFNYDENGANSTLLDILRNHHYKILITDVRSNGWNTLAEALTAMPDNRVTSWCTDESPNITDIEATRDYYLGVGNDIVAKYDGAAVVDIATTYPGLNGKTDWKDRISLIPDSDDDWILAGDVVWSSIEENGNEIRVSIPLSVNSDPKARYGKLTVRAGKLSRVINITQEGCPYNRRRKVEMVGVKKNGVDFTMTDYFSFIDGVAYDDNGNATSDVVTEKVFGLSKDENRNEVRNGLHFPAVPLYTGVSYKIPVRKANGDPTKPDDDTANVKIVNDASGLFQLTKGTDYYVVTLKDEATIKTGTATLRIPVKFDASSPIVNVDYPLYRTGVIHYLGSAADAMQPEGCAVENGWYYYEVVRAGNCYVLDRNLGASSNRMYNSSSTDLRKYRAAVGGYFKPNTGRWASAASNKEDRETVADKLYLKSTSTQDATKGRFLPMTESDFISMNISTGNTVEAATSGGRVAEGKIYFPKAGYYEGAEQKSPLHSLLWTRTYLGGTQGLSATSAEYGYWYRYFDDMKSDNPENRFSNVRMARGSNGAVPTDASVWRYMPIRLVWVDKDFSNPGGNGSSGDEPVVVRNKVVVYFENTQNWTDLKVYGWGMPGISTDYNSGTPMTKVEGTDNLYRFETTGMPTSGSGFQIRYNNNAGTSWDYKDIYSINQQEGVTVFYIKPGVQKTDKDINNNTYTRWTLVCTDTSNVEDPGNFGGGGDDPDPPTPTTTTYKIKIGSTFQDLTQQGTSDIWKLEDYNVTSTGAAVVYKYENGSQTETWGWNGNNAKTDNTWMQLYSGNTSGPTLTTTGKMTFEYNASNQQLRISKETDPVTVKNIYLVGEMTSWGLDTGYKFSSTDGLTYTLTKKIDANVKFKMWTGAWHDAATNPGQDWGINNGSSLANGTYTTSYGGGDISLKTGGTVTLKLVFSSAADNSPELTISGQEESSGSDDYGLGEIPSGQGRVILYMKSGTNWSKVSLEVENSSNQKSEWGVALTSVGTTSDGSTVYYKNVDKTVWNVNVNDCSNKNLWCNIGTIGEGNTVYIEFDNNGATKLSNKKSVRKPLIRTARKATSAKVRR